MKGSTLCLLILLLPLTVALSVQALESHHNVTVPNYPIASSASHSSTVQPGLYWFQVGAWAADGSRYGSHFGIPVTGASVEIQVRYDHRLADSSGDISYWVGINLPGDSFIQVGYLFSASSAYPQWFWEYFTPNSAMEGAGVYHGDVGSEIGPNASWFKFSLMSSGTQWGAYVGTEQVGSADLGVSNSGSNGPFATAEVAGVRNAKSLVGPVEFRNLEYRDTSGQWHSAPAAVSLCCYGVGSDTFTGPYPYGVQGIPGESNDWLAGSNLSSPVQAEGAYLWPWYHVTVSSPQGETTRWYAYGDTIDLSNVPTISPISGTSRYYLADWIVNGVHENDITITARADEVLKANYVKQYLVQVNSPEGISTGSGWYTEGTQATIGVSPNTIPAPGILGQLGVKSVLSGWSGDFTGPVSNGQSTLLVKSPLTVNAVWSTDYGVIISTIVLGVIAIAIVVTLRLRQKSRGTA